MSDIKLFVACHKEIQIPAQPLLCPIQVGAGLAERFFPGFLRDDEGENISELNPSYCELTAQYWAWKNAAADYLGFFHYRRFLSPCGDGRRPYYLEDRLDDDALSRRRFGDIAGVIESSDIVCPIPERMYISVREHYRRAPYHHGGDLALAERIIGDICPGYLPCMESYLSQDAMFFGNIYIMRSQLFREYCSWLFPILAEFDRRADTESYSQQERRVDGYLAERLFGVYLYGLKDAKISYLPRLHFGATAGQRLGFALLPPGSRQRAVVKGVIKGRAHAAEGKL